MAIGAVYKLVDNQSFLGMTARNVYWYRQTEGTETDAAALGNLFANNIMPSICAFQTTEVVHDHIYIENQALVGDFADIYPVSGNVGVVANITMPPFVAAAFRLNRSVRGIHNGQKRYAGFPEEGAVNGILNPSYTTLMDTLAALIGSDLANDDLSLIYEPVIRHQTTPTSGVYGYIRVASAVFTRISSQNTRKYGRGE